MEQARRGDHDAVALLVHGAIGRLDTAARLILRDPELARDAVQDGLLGPGETSEACVTQTGSTRPVEPYLTDDRADHNIHGDNVTGIADLRDPIWSPGGTRIVFRRRDFVDGALRLRLLMIDADGSDLHPIGYTPGDLVDAYPVRSPDGSRIAFPRFRDAFEFVVVRLSDGSITPVDLSISASLTGDGLASLEWSPDGTEILVIEHSGAQQALIVDPDAGQSRTVPWVIEAPSWWVDRAIANGTDTGSWQRLASP